MSHEARAWADKVRGLTPSQRLTLDCLADHCRKGQNRAWPSVETIAGEKELSERSVQYALRTLEKRGHVATERPGGGFQITTVYVLSMFENGAPSAPLWDENGANDDSKRCKKRRETVQKTTRKGATVAPEPVMNLELTGKDKPRARATNPSRRTARFPRSDPGDLRSRRVLSRQGSEISGPSTRARSPEARRSSPPPEP